MQLQITFFLWGGTKSLGTAPTSGLLYKPQMIDEGDCGVDLYFLPALKMEAIYSCEMSVDFQLTTQRYITEGGILHNLRSDNLMSYICHL
jgi:hypothetical protein